MWILKLNPFSFLSSHDKVQQCSPLFQSKLMLCCWVCLKNSPATNSLRREMQTFLRFHLIGWLHIGVLHRSLELQWKHRYDIIPLFCLLKRRADTLWLLCFEVPFINASTRVRRIRNHCSGYWVFWPWRYCLATCEGSSKM